ncbi:hypothetical protein AYL99_11645 [Fonsecaea erecta]|uniref:Uncharacterized protein n=1 Tax=Fonsecaea erecta TaxID=1367422 RepID=A0A178Z2W7_9EURO|nr:hypothetical protein AYL99_11645 [Fonsecaea erecta]OAP54110.1 hypothetical protein AYL99_11645 [Fonsecaea erecta]
MYTVISRISSRATSRTTLKAIEPLGDPYLLHWCLQESPTRSHLAACFSDLNAPAKLAGVTTAGKPDDAAEVPRVCKFRTDLTMSHIQLPVSNVIVGSYYHHLRGVQPNESQALGSVHVLATRTLRYNNHYTLHQIDDGHTTLLMRRRYTAANDPGIFTAGKTLPRIITLVGDHTITQPLLRSSNKAYGPISVIHIDSHLDTIPKTRTII